MDVTEAVQSIRDSCIPAIRGKGCFTIEMEDGREYQVFSFRPPFVRRFDAEGNLVEFSEAKNVTGEVYEIRCKVDELGGVME